MEVRHIVLKGTNFEIGEALGQIAQTWLNIYPSRYEKSLFVTARNAYMQNNYPILFQRMKGVAKAYNQSYNHTLLDFSALPYDVGSFACSIMYFPITTVKNDHPLIVRNGDSLLSYRGGGGANQPSGIDTQFFSRNYVMEMYPNVGYSSMVFGSLDLINGAFDGLNSAGLYVGCLSDDKAPVSDAPIGGGKRTGLYILQLARLLLDTCATEEEAKIKILNTKITNIYTGIHMLVADKKGNYFICEISPSSEIHFTTSNNKVRVMTQFPVYSYPNQTTFPGVTPNIPLQNYKRLEKFVKSNKGKFTEKTIWDGMDEAQSDADISGEPGRLDVPVRTLWKIMIDQSTLSYKIIFYLNDKKGKKKGLNFSKTFDFKLGLSEGQYSEKAVPGKGI